MQYFLSSTLSRLQEAVCFVLNSFIDKSLTMVLLISISFFSLIEFMLLALNRVSCSLLRFHEGRIDKVMEIFLFIYHKTTVSQKNYFRYQE